MPGPTLYLFDGYNLMHAGGIEDVRELTDLLASFVALRGARGVLVFDGVGPETAHGPLEVRYAPNADTLIERLAADHRGRGGVVPRLVRRRRQGHERAAGLQAELEDLPAGSRADPARREPPLGDRRAARRRHAGETGTAPPQPRVLNLCKALVS